VKDVRRLRDKLKVRRMIVLAVEIPMVDLQVIRRDLAIHRREDQTMRHDLNDSTTLAPSDPEVIPAADVLRAPPADRPDLAACKDSPTTPDPTSFVNR